MRRHCPGTVPPDMRRPFATSSLIPEQTIHKSGTDHQRTGIQSTLVGSICVQTVGQRRKRRLTMRHRFLHVVGTFTLLFPIIELATFFCPALSTKLDRPVFGGWTLFRQSWALLRNLTIQRTKPLELALDRRIGRQMATWRKQKRHVAACLQLNHSKTPPPKIQHPVYTARAFSRHG